MIEQVTHDGGTTATGAPDEDRAFGILGHGYR
jgi:hypothetical protein